MIIQRISVSSLGCWLQCPAEFYLKYIQGFDAYNPNFSAGTEYHEHTEQYHWIDWYINHLGFTPEMVEALHKHHKTYDPKLIEAYINEVPADDYVLDSEGKPVLEEYFRVILRHPVDGRPLPIPFSGRIDRRAPSGLKDTKTSNKSWSQKMADESKQATGYIYKEWMQRGVIEPFEFVIFRKDWKPTSRFSKLQRRQTTRTIQDFIEFFELVESVLHEIETTPKYICKCPTRQHQELINILMENRV